MTKSKRPQIDVKKVEGIVQKLWSDYVASFEARRKTIIARSIEAAFPR